MSPAVRSLSCPNCGGGVVIRGFAHTLTVVCENCKAILDAKDPGLRVLQQQREKQTFTPAIPLGTRGTLRGVAWEAIGFQVRGILVDGVTYSWYEYLLFNPYEGFRYLTAYNHHWNFVTPVSTPPRALGGAALWGKATFRHFQSARAVTSFVLGEFPWEVRAKDAAEAADYVAPPRVLSSETTEDETTWSLGEYIPGSDVWAAFKLPGRAPSPVGVYANQPSPYAGRARALFRTFGVLALVLVALLFVRLATAGSRTAFEGSFRYVPRSDDTSAFVTDAFELTGRTANVEVRTEANLTNTWLDLDLALIEERTGETFELAREVSYYEGYDPEDGRWTEGSRADRAVIPSVPAGRYFLRVQPSSDGAHAVPYAITVRRDVPRPGHFLIALVLLAIPPVLAVLKQVGFEKQRWAESDHAPTVSFGGDDDD